VTVIPRFRRKSEEQRTGTMSLVDHLEELRHRIIVCMIAIACGAVVGWVIYEPFKTLMLHPYTQYVLSLPPRSRPPAGQDLVFTGVLDPMLVKIKIVMYVGLMVALPVLLYQLWAFIVPGLHDKEKKMAIPFIASSVVLFALGGLVAFVTLPKALTFLLGFAGARVVPLISFNQYIAFVVLVTIAFGVSFELPILLVFLEIIGVLSSDRLRQWRRPAILGVAIFAAVITPSQDPFTMLAMMIPMLVFYEASIIIGRMLKK